jgi:hypothetical protein
MFELARLLLNFGLTIHGQAVGKQTLCEAVTAHDVRRSLTSPRCEFHDHAAIAG